jgi:hypothetical protein
MRRARLVARDGEAYTQRWHAIWDSAEEHYFTRVRPPESFDIIVKADP